MADTKFTPYGVVNKPIKKGLADNVIEYGIKKYVDYKNYKKEPLATNQQVFVDTFLNNKKDVLTEKTFKPEELNYLRNVLKSQITSRINQFSGIEQQFYNAKQKLEATPKKQITPGALESISTAANAFKEYRKTGKISPELFNIINGKSDYFQSQVINDFANENNDNPVNYSMPLKLGISDYTNYSDKKEDWEIDEDILGQRNLTEHTPKSIIHTTLGRFNATFNPETQMFNIKDAYDFATRNLITGQTTQPKSDLAATEGGGNPFYNILRAYAGRMQPEGQVTPRQWDINFNY